MAFPFDLGSAVLAIGALGTAAFALVDATKIGRDGGVSNSGFSFIQDAVRQLFPDATRTAGSDARDPEDAGKLLDILHGHWINGSPLADQKAIAKSLIKLRLTPRTAGAFARATMVDAVVLGEIATKMTQGEELISREMNALGRFDLALTAILDEGYQRADQRYRNSTKVWASAVAVVLAVLGGLTITEGTVEAYFKGTQVWMFVIAGILATPLAPIAKDVASALQAGVKVAQAIKGKA